MTMALFVASVRATRHLEATATLSGLSGIASFKTDKAPLISFFVATVRGTKTIHVASPINSDGVMMQKEHQRDRVEILYRFRGGSRAPAVA